MRIDENNSDRLVLKENGLFNWIGGAISVCIGLFITTNGVGGLFAWGEREMFSLFGPFAVLVGAYFLASSANVSVVFDRTEKTASVTWQRLIGTKSQSFKLDNVARVRLRVSGFSSGRGRKSRFYLVMTDGSHVPLSPAATSWIKNQQLPEVVAKWLAGDGPATRPNLS